MPVAHSIRQRIMENFPQVAEFRVLSDAEQVSIPQDLPELQATIRSRLRDLPSGHDVWLLLAGLAFASMVTAELLRRMDDLGDDIQLLLFDSQTYTHHLVNWPPE